MYKTCKLPLKCLVPPLSQREVERCVSQDEMMLEAVNRPELSGVASFKGIANESCIPLWRFSLPH